MTKYWTKLLCVAGMVGFTTACTNLDEVDPANYSGSNFPSSSNPDTYRALALESVGHLRGFVSNQSSWMILEAGTDECVVPQRGGGWQDGNKWRDMHYHEWDANHSNINTVWEFIYGGVAKANNIILTLEAAEPFEGIDALVAQVKFMRALYYFQAMDMFGQRACHYGH